MELVVERAATIQGQLRPPSDKSLTHRAYMLASIASGPSEIERPLRSQDCEHTIACLAQMGLKFHDGGDHRCIEPEALWHSPNDPLACGNSGTTMRLLSGLISARPITATMVGDESLSRRPMGRVAEPLRLMGATVTGETPPIAIEGGDLRAIEYHSPVASAQVKSCILLAGLRAEGTTVVHEPSLSRDHTERMLGGLGCDVRTLSGDGKSITRLVPGNRVEGFRFAVPGDISSAAFFLVAACIVPRARLRLTQLGVNPTRTGILEVLSQVGASFTLEGTGVELNEPIADLEIQHPTNLKPFQIDGAIVPRLIDEIPVLAVLASQCDGVSSIRGAAELRVKESDRIELIACNLRAMGAKVETHPDGLSIAGPTSLSGIVVDAANDHRIAMAFAIAGLIAEGKTTIKGAESIRTSYPEFENHLRSLYIA